MEKILETLETKSRKALEMVKKQLLSKKIENKEIQQALEYYAKNWDDTLHPGIIATACEAIGGDAKESLPIQVAMLFLTAAIDIHDDIIDESQIKNGKHTVFGKFGRDITLLVGDGILLQGMTMINSYVGKVPTKTMKDLISTIENGFTEAGVAQALELGFKGRVNVDPDDYFEVLKKKAAILETHTRIGALIGGGTQSEINALGEYGRILGTLILLRDELIDVFEAQELGNKMKSGCLPLPILYTFKNSQTKEKILKILSKPKISEEDAESIVDIVFAEKSVESLRKEMESLVVKARRIISKLRQKEELESLLMATLEAI